MKYLVKAIGFCLFGISNLNGQNNPIWDNTEHNKWNNSFDLVEILSTTDSSNQKAWVYSSKKSEKQPLIISLHTWSGDYNQEDPLAKEAVLRDWNYIHPDFRGTNNNPNACGSELVIADIKDAIVYAVNNINVDKNNIHIVGVSGGGYAALLTYMNLDYRIKSFNAWVPISDLSAWYWESKGRKSKYSNDIEGVAMKDGIMDWDILKNRSPINLKFTSNFNDDSQLNIYTGIHDGYTGSVPILHSILFFNKVAEHFYPNNKKLQVEDSLMCIMVTEQLNHHADNSFSLFNRLIHLQKKSSKVNLTIFEGGHEMLSEIALTLLPQKEDKVMERLNILTIGDSNGAFDYGWPDQLRKLMPYSKIINKSIAGNTIGFDNLGNENLNTIRNIQKYLDQTISEIQTANHLDCILICLGTNDSKSIYRDSQSIVIQNYELLILKIKSYFTNLNMKIPSIYIISSPPMDIDKIDIGKYSGGDIRIARNNREFEKIANKMNIGFINIYDVLKTDFSEKTGDGIHLNEKCQFEMAQSIVKEILLNFKK